MKLPPKHTNVYKVLEVIYKHGPMTSAAVASWIPTIDRDSVMNAVRHLTADRLLVRTGMTYDLARGVLRYFDGCQVHCDTQRPEIVPPRQYNVYEALPLSTKYQISANGSRPGSNDFKAWPSRHLEAA